MAVATSGAPAVTTGSCYRMRRTRPAVEAGGRRRQRRRRRRRHGGGGAVLLLPGVAHWPHHNAATKEPPLLSACLIASGDAAAAALEGRGGPPAARRGRWSAAFGIHDLGEVVLKLASPEAEAPLVLRVEVSLVRATVLVRFAAEDKATPPYRVINRLSSAVTVNQVGVPAVCATRVPSHGLANYVLEAPTLEPVLSIAMADGDGDGGGGGTPLGELSLSKIGEEVTFEIAAAAAPAAAPSSAPAGGGRGRRRRRTDDAADATATAANGDDGGGGERCYRRVLPGGGGGPDEGGHDRHAAAALARSRRPRRRRRRHRTLRLLPHSARRIPFGPFASRADLSVGAGRSHRTGSVGRPPQSRVLLRVAASRQYARCHAAAGDAPSQPSGARDLAVRLPRVCAKAAPVHEPPLLPSHFLLPARARRRSGLAGDGPPPPPPPPSPPHPHLTPILPAALHRRRPARDPLATPSRRSRAAPPPPPPDAAAAEPAAADAAEHAPRRRRRRRRRCRRCRRRPRRRRRRRRVAGRIPRVLHRNPALHRWYAGTRLECGTARHLLTPLLNSLHPLLYRC